MPPRLIGRRRLIGSPQLAGPQQGYSWRDRFLNSPYGDIAAYGQLAPEEVGADPYSGHPVSVQPVPGRPGSMVLGFSAVVGANATVNIIQRPQVPFRPDRFYVAGSLAPSFEIDDIKAGIKSFFAATGAVPAEIFSQDATNALTSTYTVTTSMDLIVTVTNLTAGSLTFRGAAIGRGLV